MKRREMLSGALTGVALAGCKRRKTTVPDVDPEIGEKSTPETIAALLPIESGQADEVRKRLEDHAFETATPGVHYARMVVLPEDNALLLSGVFDNTLEALLQLMGTNAARVDHVLSLCEGYPGAADRVPLENWLKAHEAKTLMLYSAFSRASEPAVREATQLRREFLKFVESVQRQPAQAEDAYTKFLEANRARIDTHRESAVDQLSPSTLTAPEDQNPFTMVFDLHEDWVKRLEKTLTDGQWFLDHLHIHPLEKIPTVHYARFAQITRTRILFQSVYDGEWEQYLADFAVNIPKQLDLVWGGAVGYPKSGAADAAALTKFLDSRRVHRDYFYVAYADDTVKEIQASLALGEKLIRFSKEAPADAERLVRHTERFVHRHQELLA